MPGPLRMNFSDFDDPVSLYLMPPAGQRVFFFIIKLNISSHFLKGLPQMMNPNHSGDPLILHHYEVDIFGC